MFSFFKKKLFPTAPVAPTLPAGGPDTGPDSGASTDTGPAPTPTVKDSQLPAPGGPIAAPVTPVAPVPPAPVAAGTLIGRALVQPIEIPLPPLVPPERQKWLEKLKAGLGKTASSISGVFGGSQINEALYEDLESALLMADAGVPATEFLLADLRRKVAASGITHPIALKNALIASLTDMLLPLEKPLVIGEHKPTVIMVVGVNGAGKTTSIGKLTRHLADHGAKVLLAAGDTFRAAAREQLTIWADRNTVEIISQEGGDPAAVCFDAVSAGRARGKDVVLVDTAGRLPTQIHLMDELKKIKRVVQKAEPSAPHEILLVIDGNTGQNALTQVKAFDDALQLTGLIVTKLDGTAKGGVLAAIARGRAIPVYFIGVGEKLEELETFNAREFAQALLA